MSRLASHVTQNINQVQYHTIHKQDAVHIEQHKETNFFFFN